MSNLEIFEGAPQSHSSGSNQTMYVGAGSEWSTIDILLEPKLAAESKFLEAPDPCMSYNKRKLKIMIPSGLAVFICTYMMSENCRPR